jgi:WhiB family transcriptional regulator, redox-sensing transcriptional regulator
MAPGVQGAVMSTPAGTPALLRVVMTREEAAGLEWQDRALCAETDPDAFFPEKGEPTTAARRVCMACEVRAECLDYALRTGQQFGVWGGLSPQERRDMRRKAA